MPKVSDSEMTSLSMPSKNAKNAADVVAKAQARAEHTISFGSSKRTRDNLEFS